MRTVASPLGGPVYLWTPCWPTRLPHSFSRRRCPSVSSPLVVVCSVSRVDRPSSCANAFTSRTQVGREGRSNSARASVAQRQGRRPQDEPSAQKQTRAQRRKEPRAEEATRPVGVRVRVGVRVLVLLVALPHHRGFAKACQRVQREEGELSVVVQQGRAEVDAAVVATSRGGETQTVGSASPVAA